LGVVLIGTWGTSALRWKVIDSRINDSIYIHPEWLNTFNPDGHFYFTGFKTAQLNHDGSVIKMLELYGGVRVGELDVATGNMIERIPPPEGSNYNSFVVPSKLNDDIYFANLYNQYILSGNSIKARISEFDIRGISSADFSYRGNEENIIYMLVDNYFYMLNYNIARTMMSCKMAYEIHNITSTSDGRYIIANGTNSIHFFDTEMFYRFVEW
jgi:hypothetical protein